ncbi:MAG: anti-sigma factor [Actinomycetota bacterium]
MLRTVEISETTMADDLTPAQPDDAPGALDADLSALLADPAMWETPDPAGADALVAAIAADRGDGATPHTEKAHPPAPAPVVEIGAYRRRLAPILAGAAAIVVLLAGALIVAVVDGDDVSDGVLIALSGTDLAPDAAAEADIADTPIGTRILLDVTDLPPAEDGTYYEAWLRQSAEVGVSAGTFHMRGGDGEIELWAGVTLDDYPLITVTLQQEDGGAASSGAVVLRGSAG